MKIPCAFIISLAGSINRNGDTNAYITFPADDQFQVVTSAGERVLVTDTYAKFTNDVRGPRFVDADNLDYFLNPAGLSELHSANFYSGSIWEWIYPVGHQKT